MYFVHHCQKHTSLETFFPSDSRAAVQPDEACWWALSRVLVDARTGTFFREKCPYKEFHRRLRHDRKNSENCTDPEVRFLAQKYSVIGPNCFLKPYCSLSMLCMRTQLFKSVNNPECMKQHCTPTLMTTRSTIGALHNNSSLNCRSHNLKYFSENNDQLCALRYYGGHCWILGVRTVHCPVWIGSMIITSCTNAAARRC